MTIEFRAANGALPARAPVLDIGGMSRPCNAIQLSIGGNRQTPLVGGDMLERLERLLHIRLGAKPQAQPH